MSENNTDTVKSPDDVKKLENSSSAKKGAKKTSKKKTQATPSSCDTQRKSKHLNKRQKLKLKLTAQIIEKSAHTYRTREGAELPLSRFTDPFNDDIYIDAMNRAEWMIRKIEAENNAPIAIYQIFDPMDINSHVELETLIPKSGFEKLGSRESIQKLIAIVWEAMEEVITLAPKNFYSEDDNDRFILDKINQIANRWSAGKNKQLPRSTYDKILNDLKKSLTTKMQFIPKTQSIYEAEKLQHFKDYCSVERIQDHENHRKHFSPTIKNILRPYPFFLFACILQHHGKLEKYTGKLSIKASQLPPDSSISQTSIDLSTTNLDNLLNSQMFPEFNRLFDEEFRYNGWDEPRGLNPLISIPPKDITSEEYSADTPPPPPPSNSTETTEDLSP